MSSPELLQITEKIYSREPKLWGKNDDDHPELILIFGWMNAQLKHLKKYMDDYSEIYPTTRQLLIRSSGSMFWTRDKFKLEALVPALNIISGHSEGSNARPPNVLVHIFSNGGGFEFLRFSRLLNGSQQLHRRERLPRTCFVFDSLPGSDDSSCVRGFTVGVQNPTLRVFTFVLFTFLYWVLKIFSGVRRTPSLFAALRQDLQDPRLLPWTDEETPRLYIYSSVDRVVGADAVKAHIEEAMSMGLNVTSERLAGTGHVEHGKGDRERYWGSIQNLWNSTRLSSK
ncbi:hypothetical protein C8R43DRAFT_894364 [Mycena crocata]|nr:hypothetical protein C8R43DRAFT_894364 [Mycena crocata]